MKKILIALAAFILSLGTFTVPAMATDGLTIFGETLYYIGMSWVETAESIQERNEAI